MGRGKSSSAFLQQGHRAWGKREGGREGEKGGKREGGKAGRSRQAVKKGGRKRKRKRKESAVQVCAHPGEPRLMSGSQLE